MGLLQQVYIVDNGGQRGLDLVGDVGDELGAHPLGAHLLLGRHHDHIGQAVQLLGHILEAADHQLFVHLDLQVAPPHPLGRLQKGGIDIGAVDHHCQGDGKADEEQQTAVPQQPGEGAAANQQPSNQPLPAQGQQAIELAHPADQPGEELLDGLPGPAHKADGHGPQDLIGPAQALPAEMPAPDRNSPA